MAWQSGRPAGSGLSSSCTNPAAVPGSPGAAATKDLPLSGKRRRRREPSSRRCFARENICIFDANGKPPPSTQPIEGLLRGTWLRRGVPDGCPSAICGPQRLLRVQRSLGLARKGWPRTLSREQLRWLGFWRYVGIRGAISGPSPRRCPAGVHQDAGGECEGVTAAVASLMA